MNKITLPGTVWIASDVHLGPDAPATAREFYAFLDKACAQADALLLCGDIFDAWIGDDLALSIPEDWLTAAIGALRNTSARIPLWLGRGNRDFLLGPQFAQHVGARLLPETALLDTQAGQVILSHGDEYCTEDADYQRFRRIVRNKIIQRLFLALSPRLRRRIAMSARHRSMAGHGRKTAAIMDVTPAVIEKTLAGTQAQLLVHGHTHRPAVHTLVVAEKERRRIVLPDWEFDHASPERGGWLSLDAQGARLHQWTTSSP